MKAITGAILILAAIIASAHQMQTISVYVGLLGGLYLGADLLRWYASLWPAETAPKPKQAAREATGTTTAPHEPRA